MHRRPIALLLAAATVWSAVPSPAMAQEAETDRAARRDALLERTRAEQARESGSSTFDGRIRREQPSAVTRMPESTTGSSISIVFSGGTLTDYVAALSRSSAEPANVLLRGETDRVVIGPVTLEEVPLLSALEIVAGEYVLDGRQYTVVTREFRSAEGRPVHSVQVYGDTGPGRSSAAQETRRDFLVLQIKEITTALPGDPPESVVPAETVLTAIEAVLEIAGDAEETQVKYHAPSGLVMLAGPVNSLRAAEQVLSQISRDTSTRRSRARELQTSQGLTNPEMLESELADAQADLELAEVRMHVAAERYELAEQGLAKTQDLVDGGFVHEGELEQRRFKLIESQSEIEECRIEMERQHQRVEQLRRSLERARAISAGGGNADETDALRAENAMLRDRLAVMEAQLRALQENLNTRNSAGRTNTGGGRTGGGR
ncbi:MAG: hypothetical protein ACF8LK_03550 [Phycisphaerales bacterium JB041]